MKDDKVIIINLSDMYTVQILQCNLSNLDALGTHPECPDFKGCMISVRHIQDHMQCPHYSGCLYFRGVRKAELYPFLCDLCRGKTSASMLTCKKLPSQIQCHTSTRLELLVGWRKG